MSPSDQTLFSKIAFTTGLAKTAAEREDVHLFSVTDVLESFETR